MAGEPPRVPTAGDPVKYGEDGGGWDGWQAYRNRSGRCVKPGWDEDVELHEGEHWNVGLCAGVGSSGDVGGVGVDGADSVGSGGGVGGAVGGGCGDSGSIGYVGGSWLCGSGIWVKWWGFCHGGGAGGFWGVVVWLEDGFVVLEWQDGLLATFQSDVGGGEHVCSGRCASLWYCDLTWIFGLFGFSGVVGGGGGVDVADVVWGLTLSEGWWGCWR